MVDEWIKLFNMFLILMVSIEYGLCEMLNTTAIRPPMAPEDGNFTFNISACEATLPGGTVDHTVEPVYQKLPRWEETVAAARDRYVDVIKALADKYPSENLLLVTHAEAVGVSVSAFAKQDITVYEVEYCAYSELQRSISFDKDNACTADNLEAQIKIALDRIQIDPSKDIFSSSVPPSKRMRKDVNLNEQAKLKMHEKYAQMKEHTDAVANCFDDAISGDPISKAALEMDADTLNEEGETVLHVESMRGYTERVRFIVREFANKKLLVKLDGLIQTALHLAAQHGHIQVVEVLIDAARHLPSSSANDDAHNPVSSFQDFIRQANVPHRNTALHLAVINGNVAIIKLLVMADPNDSHVQNHEGKTPIYIAAENGYKDVIKEMCTTCTALSLDGPDGRTTALHALIQNIGPVYIIIFSENTTY